VDRTQQIRNYLGLDALEAAEEAYRKAAGVPLSRQGSDEPYWYSLNIYRQQVKRVRSLIPDDRLADLDVTGRTDILLSTQLLVVLGYGPDNMRYGAAQVAADILCREMGMGLTWEDTAVDIHHGDDEAFVKGMDEVRDMLESMGRRYIRRWSPGDLEEEE
jgi:hypothetical protein